MLKSRIDDFITQNGALLDELGNGLAKLQYHACALMAVGDSYLYELAESSRALRNLQSGIMLTDNDTNPFQRHHQNAVDNVKALQARLMASINNYVGKDDSQALLLNHVGSALEPRIVAALTHYSQQAETPRLLQPYLLTITTARQPVTELRYDAQSTPCRHRSSFYTDEKGELRCASLPFQNEVSMDSTRIDALLKHSDDALKSYAESLGAFQAQFIDAARPGQTHSQAVVSGNPKKQVDALIAQQKQLRDTIHQGLQPGEDERLVMDQAAHHLRPAIAASLIEHASHHLEKIDTRLFAEVIHQPPFQAKIDALAVFILADLNEVMKNPYKAQSSLSRQFAAFHENLVTQCALDPNLKCLVEIPDHYDNPRFTPGLSEYAWTAAAQRAGMIELEILQQPQAHAETVPPQEFFGQRGAEGYIPPTAPRLFSFLGH